MGQTYLKRTHFKARETVVTPQNSAQQLVNRTCLFAIGDVVDVVDVDINGNVTSVIADNLVVLGIVKDQEIALDTIVDTSTAVGTPMLVNQSIDDGQSAMERAICNTVISDSEFVLTADILDKGLNEPSGGKTTYDIADSSFWRAGDLADIFDDNGLVASDVTIESVNINADDTLNKSTIVITTLVDVTLGNNPYLLNKTITGSSAIRRNQERIDEIDRPVKNEYKGVGNGAQTCWEATNLFLQSSTDVDVDGRKGRLGTAGTRATLSQGAANSQLIFTSMILGILGNEIEVEVQSGAGFTITVTEDFKVNANGTNFSASQYLIQINDNGGAATSQQIADALNADATVRRLVQVQYGGDGTGVVATFGPTNLASGADDGTGDYAELEQVFENSIATTGYKFISFHIRPNERNRLSEPPADDEDVTLGYSRAHDNVDR